MKRTKKINRTRFRKNYRIRNITPIALVVFTTFVLSACEKSDENFALHIKSDDCKHANYLIKEQCNIDHNKAKQKVINDAPKYTSYSDYVAKFNEDQRDQIQSKSTDTKAEPRQNENMWLPLIAGYAIGRMTSNSHLQQPLFSAPTVNSLARDQFTDIRGSGHETVTSTKSTALPKRSSSPKLVTSQTITRGGFGETISKQRAKIINNNVTYRAIGS